MRIKEDIKIRKIGNEKILIVNDGQRSDYTRVVSLNDTAAFLLEKTGNDDFTAQTWAEMLFSEYDVDMDTALKDVSLLIEKLTKIGIIL